MLEEEERHVYAESLMIKLTWRTSFHWNRVLLVGGWSGWVVGVDAHRGADAHCVREDKWG